MRRSKFVTTLSKIPTTVLSVRIDANADDKHQAASDGAISDGASVQTNSTSPWAAFRWDGLGLSSGITIVSAYLYLSRSGNSTVNLTVAAEDTSGDPSAIGSTASYISQLTKTTNTVSWIPNGSESAVDAFQSPDLRAIIQELVDSYGALSAIVITLNRSANGMTWVAHNTSPAAAARLRIEYR